MSNPEATDSDTTKERPILFSGAMVRAILDRRKSQTRRVVTKSTSACASPWGRLVFDDTQVPCGAMPLFADDGYLHVPCRPHPDEPQTADYWTRDRVYCRFEPGDRLWVRESFCGHWTAHAGRNNEWCGCKVLPERCLTNGESIPQNNGSTSVTSPDNPLGLWYKATSEKPCGHSRWKPSIHMPRWASRITLEVAGVRVERVQDISWSDAIAEGCKDPRRCAIRIDPANPKSPVFQFRELWDSINAKRGYGWEENPWVFVVEFRED